MRIFVFVTALLLSFSAAPSFGQQPASLFGDMPSGRYQHLFRIDGSNTIGAELGPALAEAWLTSHGASKLSRVPMAENETRITGYLEVLALLSLLILRPTALARGLKRFRKG